MAYAYKVGDTGLTQDGSKYRVVCNDMKNLYPVVAIVTDDDGESVQEYTADGRYYTDDPHKLDLLLPTRVGFINIYPPNFATLPTGCINSTSAVYPSREAADIGATRYRLACVEVTIPKG